MDIERHIAGIIAGAERVRRPMARPEIITYLAQARVPALERFIRFEEQYGGLSIYMPARQERVSLGIISEYPGKVEAEQEDGRWFVFCGDFGMAPFNFLMDEYGTLYASTIPFAASLEC